MKTNKKRLLCWFLSFLLLISAVPLTAVTANAEAPVSYLDENGEKKQCPKYTVISAVPINSTYNEMVLSSGWYVVDSDTTINSRITVIGDVHLILADGKKLEANERIAVTTGNSFTVYAQSAGDNMGKLNAKATFRSSAAIGGMENGGTGTITINGGNITATALDVSAGIGGGQYGSCGTITINGGIVTATGGAWFPGIGTSTNDGGTVKISGGTVKATAGSNCSHAVNAGNVYVSPKTNTAIYVKAGGSADTAASVTGSPFTAETTIKDLVANKNYVETVVGIKYLDKNGTTQLCTEYTVINNQTTLSSGWYVVNSDVTISDRITVSGNVRLILSDGKTLNASGGINVAEGYSFTIYAQSTGDTVGKLQASASEGTCIGGNDFDSAGNITINGGIITAAGGTYGAGIGGGYEGAGATVTINGGTVNATGGKYAAGIGGGDLGNGGTVTINGGTVEATGGDRGAGIGGGNTGAGATVTINGGTVTAAGGNNGAGIGGGYEGAGGTVIIYGGTVEATAGTDCDNAIGAGYNSTSNGTLTVSPKDSAIYVTAGDAANNAESIVGSPFTTETEIIGKVVGEKYVKTTVGQAPVKYLDENGAEQQCTEYTTISAMDIYYGVTLTSGWYVVDAGAETEGIVINGDVHFIVADGTELTVKNRIAVRTGNSFTVYAQSAGDNMGKLTVKATWRSSAAIGGEENGGTGTITINGGNITATGPNVGAGIGGGQYDSCGTITINGGIVTATGGEYFPGIGTSNNQGTVTITGGTVKATAGPRCSHPVNAGNVYVSPKTNTAIYVKAGDSAETAASVTGSPFTATTMIKDLVANKSYVETVVGIAPVKYLDENGAEQQCTEYTELTDRTTLSDGWYVVNSDVTILDRITVSGNVRLILANGKTLNAESGITVAEGNSFTIYAQSAGDTMGKLTAKGPHSNAGIGGKSNESGGTVTVNGGIITATSENYAAGIGGGYNGEGATVTINGGIVTATGGKFAAGIGGGDSGNGGIVAINGGTVTATGGERGAGIGGGDAGAGATVTINGGTVTATGEKYAAGIGGGNTGAGGTVIIYGGTVEATAGAAGDKAIGAGYRSTSNGTLTVSPKAVDSAIYVKAGDAADSAANVGGSPFITEQDIINSVAGKKYVKTCSASIPAYTVTIPETVELGDSAEISAENVSLPDGFSLCVKLTDASDFKVKSDKGAELSYTITKDGAPITVNAIVLSVPGGSDTGAATLVFSKPENPVYAGKYKGSLTFSIKIE